MVTIHEFATENPDVLLMFPPLGCGWDIFDLVRPELQKRFHVMVVSYPGLDEAQPDRDFSSVEQVVEEVEDALLDRGMSHLRCVFGCSMGGGMVARMISNGRILADCFVMDGGMTPYELPKPVTYLIGVRDYLMICVARVVGVKALREVMNPDKYSETDAEYMMSCLRSMSGRTVWRCFYSANNYQLDLPMQEPCGRVVYWYGDEEEKDRAWDIRYVQRHMPWAELVRNQGVGHAELFTLQPDRFVSMLLQVAG